MITREVSYAGRACTIKAFVAEPASATTSPAVIVVQEWWGLNDHIRDVARRLGTRRILCDRARLVLAPGPQGRD